MAQNQEEENVDELISDQKVYKYEKPVEQPGKFESDGVPLTNKINVMGLLKQMKDNEQHLEGPEAEAYEKFVVDPNLGNSLYNKQVQMEKESGKNTFGQSQQIVDHEEFKDVPFFMK